MAVELVVQTSPPKWGMGGAAVRTFSFDTARSRVPKDVSSAVQQGRVQTRRGGTQPRQMGHGGCLGAKGQSGATSGCARAGTVDRVDTGGGR